MLIILKKSHAIWCWVKTPDIASPADEQCDNLDVELVPNGQRPLSPPRGSVASW